MGLTEEEADFLKSSTTFTPVRPPPFPLKYKRPQARLRSNSLSGLNTNSYKISSNLTGPPSPSISRATRSISGLDTNLASSLWPQKGESSRSFPTSTLSSPRLGPNSQADVETGKRVHLPPISQSRRSGPSESLPSLIPRLPRPSSPSLLSASTPSTPSTKTNARLSPFTLRPPTVKWDDLDLGPYDARNSAKDKEILWTAIQDAGVPIYLGTPGFDVFSICPSALGTYCSPTALATTFSDVEVFYHAYAAGQKLSREDLAPSKSDTDEGVLQRAADAVLAEYGAALLERNTGPHFTFINVTQDVKSNTIVRKARKLVQRFQANGIAKDRIIVSIPATEEGVHAVRLLSKEDGILVNLAMVTGMSHAAVCAEAGAAWITFHLDRLEKVYEDRRERSQGVEAIQSTIALFDMHKIDTKIMISGFRDIRRILEFPGADGFSLNKEQIVAAQTPTTQPCSVPPQSASSLPENPVTQAKDAKWPPRFFDRTEAGGSGGRFIRHFSSRLQTILLSTQTDLFYHTCLALRDFTSIIRDDVVNYRIFMMQLSHPYIGLSILTREGVKGLRARVNLRKDWRIAEAEWRSTVTGRWSPDVEWKTARVDKCEAWINADGIIEARIPEQWDRRKPVSVNIY